jgi:excisionase family DNA binding protein
MSAEVTVLSAASWQGHATELAQILRANSMGATGAFVPARSLAATHGGENATVSDASYWASHPSELDHALGGSAPTTSRPAINAGAAPVTQERLTMTVEEAAVALGISRAFAYEAVRRGEIPAITIGRRKLIPRAALEKMLGSVEPDADT